MKTLIIGASKNPERYSYKAADKLLKHGHEIELLGLRPDVIFGQTIDTEKKQFTDIDTVSKKSIDLIYCLEVFEHLPKKEAEVALSLICSLLREGGFAIMGVPIEIYLPALYKGIFRMTRRFGEFDATPGNILKSSFGFPPQHRPVSEIAIGWLYHHHHLGFDYRRFRELIKSKPLMIMKQSASPISTLGTWFNPEVYFVVQKD